MNISPLTHLPVQVDRKAFVNVFVNLRKDTHTEIHAETQRHVKMASSCFICELPILPHQTWRSWHTSLLTPTGVRVSPDGSSYTNNLYHEDCLVCANCSIRLKAPNTDSSDPARRHGNRIYCSLHFADVTGLGSSGEEFMNKLRDFKRQSLGCAEARRKSSTTLSFPIPVQACPGSSNCLGFPHSIKPTPAYWIECKGGGVPPSSSPALETTTTAASTDAADHGTSSAVGATSGSSGIGGTVSERLSATSTMRSAASSENLFLRKLERSDTSKSTSNMEPMSTLMPPTIQIYDSSHKTKDDLELYRRHGPNIIITMPQSASPPPSPPAPNQGPPPPQLPETRDGKRTSGKRDDPFELISFQEEMFEKHFHGKEHWNYFTNDEGLGPVILSLAQEQIQGRDAFRILLRTVSYSLHGVILASSICADRYDRDAVVRELGNAAGLKPNLALGQLASTPDELLKLDQVFIKSELKVGVVYIKQGQTTEEQILANRHESPAFREFLEILGERVTLRGFDKYKGGLDTVHDLTGTESVYTSIKGIEIMFHVSTMLPHEENDPQKLQKKRHIGNDIVCVAFIEGEDTLFNPACIKSHFLHTFIVVRLIDVLEDAAVNVDDSSGNSAKDENTVDNNNNDHNSQQNQETTKVHKKKYAISVVCRDEVSAFKPYLWHESTFEKGDRFREWLLTKIINGERASYSAPKFARMQDRTRSQMLEDIVTNLANHLATGQIPKPYRRGSWRPIGHMRPSSPLLDSVRDLFEGYDQLAKDFSTAFSGNTKLMCDVAFNVMGHSLKGTDSGVRKIYGVRAILAIRSRVFLEMLYGFSPIGSVGTAAASSGGTVSTNGMSGDKSTSNATSSSAFQRKQSTKGTSADGKKRRGSVTAETIHKITQIPSRMMGSEKKRRESIKTPTYLTVPSHSTNNQQTGTGGIRGAISRLVSGSWSGWGSKNRQEGFKRWQSESIYSGMINDAADGFELNGLSICADLAKVDRGKLAQSEFTIIEFDGDTFQLLIEYMHSGTCRLTCEIIPGLICAAEHFDLPDLLQACFHHTKTHMRLSVCPSMLNQLENYYWRYNSASQMVNTIFKFIDPRGGKFFQRNEYLTLSESMFASLISRSTLSLSECAKFQVMLKWATNKLGENSKPRELELMMNRLTRDLKFHKIPPNELITVSNCTLFICLSH